MKDLFNFGTTLNIIQSYTHTHTHTQKKNKKKTDTMNKPVYLSLPTLQYEFWYDYGKPKCREKSKITLHGYRQLCSLQKKQKIFMETL